MTVEEMTGSLTGFDEIGIVGRFKGEWHEMAESRPTMMLRALVFAHHLHQGSSDADAYDAAMNLPMGRLNTYFAPEPDDLMPDEPTTEAGKDSGPPE